VRAALEHEPRINLHRYPIEVRVSNGDLILDGEVENIVAKKLALELAAAIPGSTGIVDRLRVTPAQPMEDGTLRDHVRNALLQEPVLTHCTVKVWEKGKATMIRDTMPESAASIEVSVEEGVVTFNGQVPSLSHKRLAGVLAWWIPGSRDVVNGLDIVPPQEDHDDEMSDAVGLVLEKNPFVNAAQIRVSTRNSVVTLEGLVTNATEKQMAECDAWYVFGVDKVINALAVRE
jgi:osmotically-inducible protein OsmY